MNSNESKVEHPIEYTFTPSKLYANTYYNQRSKKDGKVSHSDVLSAQDISTESITSQGDATLMSSIPSPLNLNSSYGYSVSINNNYAIVGDPATCKYVSCACFEH